MCRIFGTFKAVENAGILLESGVIIVNLSSSAVTCCYKLRKPAITWGNTNLIAKFELQSSETRTKLIEPRL